MQKRIHSSTCAVAAAMKTCEAITQMMMAGDRRRSLAEPVGEFAELRPEQRGRDGVDGRERAGDRVVAVDLLHADGNGHADHGERHARDHRPNGEARRMRDAQQLGIPAEQPVDQAGVPRRGRGGRRAPLLGVLDLDGVFRGFHDPSPLPTYGRCPDAIRAPTRNLRAHGIRVATSAVEATGVRLLFLPL